MGRCARRLTVIASDAKIRINEENVFGVCKPLLHHEIKDRSRLLIPMSDDIFHPTLLNCPQDTLASGGKVI
jgi:hypothetical protein